MKNKTLIIVFACIVCVLVLDISACFAQPKNISNQKRKEMMDEAQELFFKYKQALLLLNWSSAEDVTRFKELFSKEAQIYDDICPDTASVELSGAFRFKESSTTQLPTRSIDNLIEMHSLLFDENKQPGNTKADRILNAKYNFGPLVTGYLQVVFVKESQAYTNFGKQKFSNRDTLMMEMEFDKDYRNPKIKKIQRELRNKFFYAFNMEPRRTYLACPGNVDCDALPDQEDQCPREFGMDPYGCATKKRALGFTFHGSYLASQYDGLLPAARLKNTQETNAFSYQNTALKTNIVSQFKIGAEIDFLFGNYKNWGIGGGLYYSLGIGKMSANSDYNVAYKASNSDNKNFLQVIKAQNPEENLTINTLAAPIYFKFCGRKQSLKKNNYFIHLGVVLPLLMSGNSNGTTIAEYEAYYGATQGQDGKSNLDNYKSTAYTDNNAWAINNANVSKHKDENNNVDEYFKRKQDAGYNVGTKEKKENSSGFNRLSGIGFIARAGLSQRINRKSNLLIGAEMIIGNNGISTVTNGSYALTENAKSGNNDYRSLMGASSALNQVSFGATVAYQFKIYSKKKETL
jgi:hypothetical protein